MMKKTLLALFLLSALLLCGCARGEDALKYTSGQCLNCGEITERAVVYRDSVYCEDCYYAVLPSICDICGKNADDGDDHNGILYCSGCFEEYCDENDVRQCANCSEFKKDCINRGTAEIAVWICEDCNSGNKFDGDDVVEETA